MIAPVRWATKKAESTMLSVQISFLYVDLLDTTGTLVAMSKQAGLFDMRDGDFEGSSPAFIVDSLCIAMSGLLFGTSPPTPFVESASGISEGGRTGLTALATSFWFFISIFFAPLLSNIPSFATGSVLVVVGALMMGNVTKINFDYAGDAIPAFVALALIPFTCKSGSFSLPRVILTCRQHRLWYHCWSRPLHPHSQCPHATRQDLSPITASRVERLEGAIRCPGNGPSTRYPRKISGICHLAAMDAKVVERQQTILDLHSRGNREAFGRTKHDSSSWACRCRSPTTGTR